LAIQVGAPPPIDTLSAPALLQALTAALGKTKAFPSVVSILQHLLVMAGELVSFRV
jgi:hypothetical protein